MNPCATNKIQHQFWNGKKVLVTGHTGFMGSWLSLWLTQLGACVSGVSLNPNTEPSLFEKAKINLLGKDYRNDIRDYLSVEKIVNEVQPEIIIHLAAQPLVLTSYKLPVETFSTNVMGTVHVLEAARQCGSVRSIAVITSDKCYENNEQAKSFKENDSLGGSDPYSASKGATEIVVSSYRKSFFALRNIPVLSFRAGNIIGGGDWSENRLIPDFVRALIAEKNLQIRSPNSIRPWQHVLEPINVYLQLIQKSYESPSEVSTAWNIGPEESSEKTVIDVIKMFTKLWGASGNYFILENAGNPQESIYLKIDSHKLKSYLNWRPILGFEDTVKWSVEWYKNFYYEKQSAQEVCLKQINQFCSRSDLHM